MKRLILLLLSMGWGYLVFGMAYSLSYEHATGYAPLRQTLPWTIAITLPMVIGALVIHAKAGWMQRVRRLCAALLAAEAGFFLILSYIKILALPPILGFLLLRNPDRPVKITSQPEMTKPWLMRHAGSAFGIGILVLFVGWQVWRWFNNPLPSDEEMIENFNTHREELDQIVRGYRNYRRPEGVGRLPHSYEMMPEAKLLMARAWVSYLGLGPGGWLPDPYSAKAAKFEWGLTTRSANPKIRPIFDSPADWKREMPELFEDGPPLTDRNHLSQKTGRMTLWYGYPRPIEKFTWRYPGALGLQKAYFYFPQPPRVENGYILNPDHTLDGKPIIRPGGRVFDSLNEYPKDFWKKGECLYRRIHPNWFLAMCRSY